MEPRANYALIGAFVIFAAIALLGFVMWLGQNQFRETFDEYDIVFDGPVTLDDGASVRYIGIKVGEVRWVRINRSDPSKVRARIRIDAETPVKEDSTATIDFAGITGVTFVQINAGSPEADPLVRRPGQPVPVIPAERTQLAEILTSSRQILSGAGETVEQLEKLLSDENVERVSNTLTHLETITARLSDDEGLAENANAALVSVREAADRFNAVGATLERVGEEADSRLATLGEDVTRFVDDAGTTFATFRDAGQQTERAASNIADLMEGSGEGAVSDVRLAAQDLRRLIVRLDAIARNIEQNPQSFVVGDALPYEESR